MATDTTCANTIVQQLGFSTSRMGVMIGAHSFTATDTSVSFQFKARARNGANACCITLDPSDTYTVEFLSVRRSRGQYKRTVKASFNDVYCDSLKRLFESETGLYLSL